MALDGDPKFDLTRFDQRYFDRLRARVAAAGKKGIYVSVMLFNGFSIEGKGNVSGDPFSGHPLNRENNVNGVGAAKGQALHTLSDPAITKFQESYVKKVIDSVNDLDNVLYEITNEDSGTPADIAWQIYLVALIKRYERSLAKQHPVGMTACWPSGRDEFLRNGPADWISPAARLSVSDGRKVVLNDTDHSYFWTDLKKHGPADQVAWVWKNFTCGNQCLFMDPYLDPSHDPGRNSPAGNQPDAYWEPLRQAMGQTRAWSERLDLALAAPHPELASSQFCLANPGKEYLVFLPAESEVSLDLSGVDGTFQGEWIHLAEGRTTPTEPVPGGSRRALKAPFSGDAVLFLQVK